MFVEIKRKIISSIILLIVKLPCHETVRCLFYKFTDHEELSNFDMWIIFHILHTICEIHSLCTEIFFHVLLSRTPKT